MLFRENIKLFQPHYANFPQLLLGLVLLLLVFVLSSISPYFLTWDNIRNILNQSSLLIILAVGMSVVIGSGGIDLSVGSIAAVSGIVVAITDHYGAPPFGSIGAGLSAGLILGLINGYFVGVVKVNPFVVTLATMSAFRGVALILTQGMPIYGFDLQFQWWGTGMIGWLPVAVLIAGSITFLAFCLIKYTVFGYHLLAIGGNEVSAARNGISVTRIKIAVYGLCGLITAFAAIVVTARLNTAEPLAGYMFEMDAIAAAVLGGTNMRGGNSNIFGAVIASILLGVVRNGLTILGIPPYYQQLLIGSILLAAVIAAEYRAVQNER